MYNKLFCQKTWHVLWSMHAAEVWFHAAAYRKTWESIPAA